jgi:hypothetical protein
MIIFYNYHNDKLDYDELYREPLHNTQIKAYDPDGIKIIEHIVKQDISLLYWLALMPYRNRGNELITRMYFEAAQKQPRGWLVGYARDVINGPWEDAELLIAECSTSSLMYAIDVLHGRFKEGESTIMTDPGNACEYSVTVIKGRWIEAEPHIMNDEILYRYYTNTHKIGE